MTAKRPGRPAAEIIARIKSGKANPNALSPSSRRRCVAYLGGEGLSVAEIAQVLRCSDRTVGRDRRELQAELAVEHDPKFAALFAGRLIAEAELAKSRIRKVTRHAETSPGDKIAGERACFEIEDKLAQRLQSMNFLPQATQRIEADVRAGVAVGLGEIRREAERLELIDQPAGGKPPAEKPKRRKKKQ